MMMNGWRAKAAQAVLLVVFMLPHVAAHAQNSSAKKPVNYDALKETISKLIAKEMKQNKVAGLSIALVDDQQVVWARGFGYADEKNEKEAAPETVYWIGSLTNLFTATAAMQLAEQGKLDINQPLKKYVPEFSIHPSSYGKGVITIRDLLTHHSGLPSAIQKGMWSSTPAPFESVVLALKDEFAAYPPGYMFSFSSLDMTLLGQAIEQASGREYGAYMREALIQPLGMAQSGFLFPKTRNGGLSKAYHKGKEMDEPLLRDVPAGGMLSTVLDLSRFMRMIFADGRANGNKILKPDTLKGMFTSQNSDVPLDMGLRVGLGWMLSGLGDIDIRNAGIVAHHAGSGLAFHSQMIVLPERKLGVVVLANSSSSTRVVNKAAAQAITLALETAYGIKQPEQKKPAAVDAKLTPAVQEEYAGQYATSMGLAEIASRPDHFHVEVMSKTLKLRPRADNTFGIQYSLFGFIPLSLGELDQYSLSRATIAGHEALAVSANNRDLLIAERIHPAPVREAWIRRLGEYTIENMGDDFPLMEQISLKAEDNLLLVECSSPFFFKGTVRFPLQAISDTEAIVSGLGRGMGETIRAAKINNREMLLYSGYRLIRK